VARIISITYNLETFDFFYAAKIIMTKQYLLIIQSIFVLFLSFSSLATANQQNSIIDAKSITTPQKAVALEPTRDQQEASLYIARSLSLNHYEKMNIDRTMSEKVYTTYLNSLDRSRLYLLKSDIDDFDIYKFRLDSALKTGQLGPAFRIYNLYQMRVVSRLKKQLAFIKHKLPTLDFTKDETILSDRSKSKWAESEDVLDDIWRRRTKSAVLSLKLDGKKPEEIKKTLIKRYENQLKRTLQVSGEDVFSAYMNAFTAIYDPHTSYFSPRSSENFNINMSLSLEGIGAVLQSDNEFTKVVRLVPGGPAQKQGQLGAADRIVGVAQGEKGEMVNVIGWRLDEVVDKIRGPKHSLVRLEVIPSESKIDTNTEEIRIVRDKVTLEEQDASSKLLHLERDGHKRTIGVITIPTFYADFKGMQEGDPNYKSTTRDVLKLLNDMRDKNKLDGLVIDLRANGGGSLDEANRLTGLFIDQGPTVQIRSASNRVEVMEDPDPKLVYNGPLIVLVNRLSASASEIFAGAIQDYGRGLIMGSPTFGKGTVQSVRPLNHGQLKITQAKFYRISGASTQHKGVIPGMLLPTTIDRTKVGEDALDNALPWDSIKPANYHYLNYIQPFLKRLNEKHNQRMKGNPEYSILLEEIALLESERTQTTISVNEKKREAQNLKFDTAQLKIINEHRRLDKLKPVKSLEEWTKLEEKKALKGDKNKDPDFVIKESGEVILDLLNMQQAIAAKLDKAA